MALNGTKHEARTRNKRAHRIEQGAWHYRLLRTALRLELEHDAALALSPIWWTWTLQLFFFRFDLI
jgi:hypothetical protein